MQEEKNKYPYELLGEFFDNIKINTLLRLLFTFKKLSDKKKVVRGILTTIIFKLVILI